MPLAEATTMTLPVQSLWAMGSLLNVVYWVKVLCEAKAWDFCVKVIMQKGCSPRPQSWRHKWLFD